MKMWLPLMISVFFSRLLLVTPAAISNLERYNFFNIELLQAVLAQNDGNVVVAPLNVKSALMTLIEGSGGRTREELLSTLRMPSNLTELRMAVAQTLALSQASKSQISFATRLFTANGLNIAANYSDALQTYYNGDVTSVDFSNPSAVNTINAWVQQATKNNIRTLVEPGSVDADTQLLLASALYFKGVWKTPFEKDDTHDGCFMVPDVGCRSVLFMRKIRNYNFAEIPALDSQVVEIPYGDGRTSMLAFLPLKEGSHALNTLVKDLSYMPISTILGTLTETEIYILIPKFAIESKLELRQSLENMGIKDLFDLSSNLSGIVPNVSAHVDRVMHNAKIEIDEEGTVASAVTGAVIVPLIGSVSERIFFNRPFLFTIVDRQTSGILFAGRVVVP